MASSIPPSTASPVRPNAGSSPLLSILQLWYLRVAVGPQLFEVVAFSPIENQIGYDRTHREAVHTAGLDEALDAELTRDRSISRLSISVEVEASLLLSWPNRQAARLGSIPSRASCAPGP
jgi:hypothetical protein